MIATLLVGLVRVLVGAAPRWVGTGPSEAQRVYFANHSSHLDTLAVWAALPARLRRRTRPVAAKDYWGRGPVRRAIALGALNSVLIDRAGAEGGDPLAPLAAALAGGDSLILFPEGTRGVEPLPAGFKSGLFRLAQRFPAVELVPVYLDNLHRSLPKGTLLPLPLLCSVRFGTPLAPLTPAGPEAAAETRDSFLLRARAAVVALA